VQLSIIEIKLRIIEITEKRLR